MVPLFKRLWLGPIEQIGVVAAPVGRIVEVRRGRSMTRSHYDLLRAITVLCSVFELHDPRAPTSFSRIHLYL